MRVRATPEKAVEREGDKLMELFGFTVIRFSQARATMQTRGIPDRRYYPTPGSRAWCHAVPAVWWEAKAGTKQSVHQKAFQELCEAEGERYLCGGVEVLEEYLVSVGLARRVPGGIEGVRAA